MWLLLTYYADIAKQDNYYYFCLTGDRFDLHDKNMKCLVGELNQYFNYIMDSQRTRNYLPIVRKLSQFIPDYLLGANMVNNNKNNLEHYLEVIELNSYVAFANPSYSNRI